MTAFEAFVGDNEVLIKSVTESDNLVAKLSNGGVKTFLINQIDPEDLVQVIGAGVAWLKSIAELAKELKELKKAVKIDSIVSLLNKNKKWMKKVGSSVIEMHFHSQWVMVMI